MPITTILQGGLGNQMFQIANAFAYAKRFGQQLVVPSETMSMDIWPDVYFDHFPKLEVHINNFGLYRENKYWYEPIPKREQIAFVGGFSSYKYFADHWDEVIDSFMPAFEFIKDGQVNYKGKVSLHVRRGDYVGLEHIHPPVTMEYLKIAIDHFLALGYKCFTVYSDDIAWCQENLQWYFDLSNCEYMFMKNGSADRKMSALFDMYTMSRHEHNIISNSTFSLWASFLNKNPNKIVVAPDENNNWFAEGMRKELDNKDLLPDNYVRIKF